MSAWSVEQQAWAWLALLVLGALALLYLIRPRRRRVEVPFGGLWRQVLLQSQAQYFGKKWQRLWSFLAVALLAGLLLSSLAEPLFRPEQAAERKVRWSTVIALDRSASMATLDQAPLQPGLLASSRMAHARKAIEDLVARAPAEEDLLLLAASGQALVASGWGAERNNLLKALEHIEPSQGGLDLAHTLDLAGQVLQGRPGPRVVLVSDGGLSLSNDGTPAVALQEIRVGQPQPAQALAREISPAALGVAETGAHQLANLAVELVHLRPLAHDPERGVLTVQVRNDGQAQVAARLVITAAEGARTLADLGRDRALQRLVEVNADPGISQHRVDDFQLTQPRLAVRIEARDPQVRDVAPWDDAGLAVLAEVRRLKVLLVGKPNQYLDAALAVSGRAEVVAIDPADYRPEAWSAAQRNRHQIDVVVLDQVRQPPPTGMPSLSLEVAPPADSTEVAQLLSGPELLVRAGDHPVVRNLSFQDTNFDQVRWLPLRPGDQVLVAATLGGGRSAPVLVANDQPVRALRLGIDLLETDLTARYAWPILVANSLAWLAGQEEPLVPVLELGRPWAVQAAQRGGQWQYLEPGQPPRAARISAGVLLGSSEVLGMHVWRDQLGREVVRPSAVPATEKPALTAAPRPPFVARESTGEVEHAAQDWPRWTRWLVAALALIALEWLLYLRRRLA